MAQYRKKPVVIDAWQITRYAVMPEWLRQAVADQKITVDGSGRAIIATVEGVMTGDPGDWIIKGVKGEFYPCKPDIFEATYEAV
jgi:hypothetical protein